MKYCSQLAIVMVSVFPMFVGNSFAQEKADPFSTTEVATTSAPVPKPSKLVVHTETLDQCIEWMQTSYAIASMKAEIDRLRQQIENDATPEQKGQADEKISRLQSGISNARQVLDRILVSTTIDYQRYQQFKQELKQFESAWYEQLITPRLVARAEIRELRAENEKLRQRIRELESHK